MTIMKNGIPIGEKNTIFGLSAMVGITITFLIKKEQINDCEIFYSTVDWKATRIDKFQKIEKAVNYFNLDYKIIRPDKNNTWLTDGLQADFEEFVALGDKEQKGIAIIYRLWNFSTHPSEKFIVINNYFYRRIESC